MDSGKFKRPAERTLTKDSEDETHDDEFVTTPQLATPEQMAQRRVVRIARPKTETSTASSGLFKNLQAPAPAAPPAATSAPKFSFGSFATSAASSEASSSGPAAPAPPPPVFPKGAFSFANAVSSFVEARKNMEASKTEESAAPPAPSKEETASFLVSESVIQPSAGEVLVCFPAKLFGFAKEEKKWVERGEGDVKIKKEMTEMMVEGDKKTTEAAPEKKAVYRLLLRDGYSLNTVVDKGVFVLTTKASKHIIFTCGTKEGPAHYLLKFVGAHGEDNASKFITQLEQVMKDVGVEAPKM